MNSSNIASSISAIIVLYWPDEATIRFIDKLTRNGWTVVAVINGIHPANRVKLERICSVDVVDNVYNVGLARAINQGCEQAFGSGATHVLLLDQDSRPSVELPVQLLDDLIRLQRDGRQIAAIGPSLVDVKGRRKAKTKVPQSLDQFASTSSIATSGSLISRSAFQAVGKMCEWLFIDGIDHEWCFRAQYNGLEIVRSNYRVMEHDMGDGGLTLLGRYRPLHTNPIRHFYIIRNTIFLSKMSYISISWRIRELLKLSYRIPTYMLISSNRIESVRKIVSGFWQGACSSSN